MARNNETSVTFRAHNEEFNKAIKEMNSESKTLRKEFKLTEAQLQQTGTETEKMAASLNYLEKAQQQAADKVALTRKQLESVKQTFGENSTEAKKMTDRLIDAETAHQKLSNQVATTKKNLEGLQQSTSDTSKNMKTLADEETELGNQTARLNAQFDLQKSKLGENATETEKLELKYSQLTQRQQQTAKQTANMEQQLQLAKQTFGENSTEAMQLEIKLAQLQTSENKLATEINNTKGAMDRQQNNLRDLQTLFQATGTNVERFADALGQDLVQALNKGTADSKQLERAIEIIGREALGTEADLGQMRTALRQIDSGGSLKGVKADLDKISKSAGTATKEAKNLKDELNNLGGGLAAGGAAGAAGAFGIVQGTQDLNTQLARLRTNAAMSGRDLTIVEDAFNRVTQVTGETDSAVETVSNLLATGFHDNQLAGMIDQINGAAIKFSDTLKTEGIADGIQETFATGEAIGSFAELLERSGVDLDTFNKGLQQAQEKGQGTTYIMQTMSELGFGTVLDKYQELNPEVQKSAEANAKLQQAMADLGIALTPVITYVTQLVTKFTEWAAQNPQLAQGFTILMGVLGMIGSAILALMPVFLALSNGFGSVILKVKEAGGVINLLRPVLAALTGPIGLVVAAVVGLIAIFVALYKNNEDFRVKVQQIWQQIKTAFETALKAILSVVKSIMSSVLSFAKEILDKLKAFWDQNGKAIVSLVKSAFGQVQSNIKSVMSTIQSIFQAVWPIISGVVQTTWAVIKTVIKSALDLILGIIQTFIRVFQGDWKGAFESIKQTASNIMNNIKSTFENIDLKQIGKDIINGLVKGISGMAGTVKKKVKELANLIPNGMKDLLGINSPSKVTTELGEWTGEGLANGLENMKRMVTKAAGLLATSAVPDVSAASLGGIGSQAISENLNMTLANQQPIIVESVTHLDGEVVARNQEPYLDSRFGKTTSNKLYVNGRRGR